MPEKSIQQYVWDPDVEGALEQITDTFAHRIHPDQQTRVYKFHQDATDRIRAKCFERYHRNHDKMDEVLQITRGSQLGHLIIESYQVCLEAWIDLGYLEDPSDLIQSWALNAMIATYGPHYHRA